MRFSLRYLLILVTLCFLLLPAMRSAIETIQQQRDEARLQAELERPLLDLNGGSITPAESQEIREWVSRMRKRRESSNPLQDSTADMPHRPTGNRDSAPGTSASE